MAPTCASRSSSRRRLSYRVLRPKFVAREDRDKRTAGGAAPHSHLVSPRLALFFLGSRHATIAPRVWPWLAVRSFHLLTDGKVIYCDHRRELFEESSPELTPEAESSALPGILTDYNDLVCPYCGRPIKDAALDLSSVPQELVRSDGPIGTPTAVFTFGRGQRASP